LPGRPTSMAIEGQLVELAIQDVLQLLELARKSGVLTVRSEPSNDEAIVHFSKGEIVFAVRRRSTRRIGQLLIRAGRLTQRELDRALEMQRADPSRRLAEILLEMGSVGEKVLERQLRFQMEESIYELMGWDDGYFRFEEQKELAEQRLLARIRVESLLMEGARRIDEWTRLESKVPSPESVPYLAHPGERDGPPLELRTEEWEVLSELDNERDVRQLAADLGRSAFDVARTIFGLVSMGVVQTRERTNPMPELGLQHEIERAGTLLDHGRADEAQRLVAALETAHPQDAGLAMLGGRILLVQKRVRAATEAFARAAALDPASAEAHFHLGMAALQTGELGRAGEAWNTYVGLVPNGSRRALVEQGLTAVHTLSHVIATVSLEP
jgi:tetratricopeptide (TPR) repeat protein